MVKDNVFGFAQVDIHVVDALYENFKEMPPLFVVHEIPEECIPEPMKAYRGQAKRSETIY